MPYEATGAMGKRGTGPIGPRLEDTHRVGESYCEEHRGEMGGNGPKPGQSAFIARPGSGCAPQRLVEPASFRVATPASVLA